MQIILLKNNKIHRYGNNLTMEERLFSLKYISDELNDTGKDFCICSNSRCSKIESFVGEFKKCGVCKYLCYCSRQCQQMDWPQHKSVCSSDFFDKNAQNYENADLYYMG